MVAARTANHQSIPEPEKKLYTIPTLCIGGRISGVMMPMNSDRNDGKATGMAGNILLSTEVHGSAWDSSLP